MIPQDLTYDFPQAAFALFIGFLLLWLFWILFNYRKEILTTFADPSVLTKIMMPRSTKTYWMKAFAAIGTWLLCVLALMQPKGNAHYAEESLNLPEQSKQNNIPEEQLVKIRKRAHEVIFLIDASASMSVPDSRSRTRLDFAKEIADQIVTLFNGETGSLYAFTSQTIPLSPSTSDYLFLRLMMRQIQINEEGTVGTNIIEALSEMQKVFQRTRCQA